ncbi:MAG TPA: hypothetical protein VLW51_05865 [Solirubrobacteraceae bacterium]|nr:hypothetical protein [Solirubrobacteraceae bacterium]
MSKSSKDEKKGKKKTGDDAAGDAARGAVAPSVANHPRASYQVRRAKGWGGVAGFAIAGYLSYKAGVPTFDVGVRALVAGIVSYMLAWMCAVTVWRHLVLAELRAAVERSQAPDPDLIPARAQKPAPAGEGSPAQAGAGAGS